MPMVIANWEEGFEIAQSRRRAGRLSWVAMPTRHDSRGYRKLIRSEGGVSAFACWVVMVQVAARCSIRGTLADDRGHSLDCSDLEAMTDIPEKCFKKAIPLLCDIGWLICSEDVPTILGADSEPSTTTVHNNTDNTEQNITPHPTLIYQHRAKADENYQKIPSKYRRGKGKWRQAWVEVVVGEQIKPEVVISAIVEYYKSGEGQSEFFRNPATLLFDHIWEEDPETWNSKHAPKLDESIAFDGIFEENEA